MIHKGQKKIHYFCCTFGKVLQMPKNFTENAIYNY